MNKEAGHDDTQKIGLQYILSMPGLIDVAKVGDFGAKKYGQWNYKKGMKWMRLLGSCSRHLCSFIGGEDIDRESGISHIAHFVYDGLMLLDYTKRHKELDDRFVDELDAPIFKPFTEEEKLVLDNYGSECGEHCELCH